MAGREYVDFDLTLSGERAGYSVRAYSAGRSASNQFDLPFNEDELERFFGIFGGRQVRSGEPPQFELVRTFGGRLFEAVFDDQLEAFFRESKRRAEQDGKGLRIRVSVEGAPELADVPWEYLYRRSGDDFPGLSNWTPIVRFQPSDEGLARVAVAPPLRICVALSNPIEYQDTLDVEEEWEQLNQSLGDLIGKGQVVLHRLEAATEEALQRELRRAEYHVFHFVGHGEFNEQADDGVLLFEDERRRTKLVTGRRLGTILRDSRPLRLVVLNNCESARASDTDPFGGVAQSLIRMGIPAVVAMQFKITDDAAISFAEEFYSGIGDGYPVDASLAEARKAINRGNTAYEFGSPVLYMGSGDGSIFDIDQAALAPPTPHSDSEPEVDPGLDTEADPEPGTDPTPPDGAGDADRTVVMPPPAKATEEEPEPGVVDKLKRPWVAVAAVAVLAVGAFGISQLGGGGDTTIPDTSTSTPTSTSAPTTTATSVTTVVTVPVASLDLYNAVAAATALVVDLDEDGVLEVIVPGPDQATGDFNGDGVTDLFEADGATWSYLPGGVGEHVQLRASTDTIETLGFGDFDGDSVTDVFLTNGVAWNAYPGGSGVPDQLITSAFTIDGLQLGDFDGDGIADVFTRMAAGWEISSGGRRVWEVTRADVPEVAVADMAVGDFDNDGRADLFYVVDGNYGAGFAAVRAQLLQPAERPLGDLRFGDADQDGRTDVLYEEGGTWFVSLGGSDSFVELDTITR